MEQLAAIKENKPNRKGLVVVAYVVCALTTMCGIIYVFYGIIPAYLAISRPGAPDAKMLSQAISFVMWAHFFMLPLQIFCLVMERLLLRYVNDLRPSLWYCLLVTACISLVCISVVNLPLSIILLVRLFAKRRFYFS